MPQQDEPYDQTFARTIEYSEHAARCRSDKIAKLDWHSWKLLWNMHRKDCTPQQFQDKALVFVQKLMERDGR
jgi:hypothetical protein